ncbi:MAG: BTAD domain-containing putative transcriptional regulator [Deltaproteobacteria bacterium]
MTLICAGRKGIPREMIADLLWPETDGDRAHQNMNTTLHRLRRLLNQEDAVENENGRLVLSMQYCWVDAWSFEALFDQAMHSRSLSEKEKLLKKSVALYTGPMEADAVAEISLSYTERLKSKFARIIIELGSLLYENGKTEEALDLYRSALEIEDSAENLYQALIGTLNILGRATESIEMYRKCCMVLKTKYGTEPSPQTRALYRKATASSG